MEISLRFLGAAGTVTGSKYRLDLGTHKWLIDCGLFQGHRSLRERNWRHPAINPSELRGCFSPTLISIIPATYPF